MPILFGQVGAPSSSSASDGSNLPALQGKQGDIIVSELHGKYFTQNYRGNLYYGASAAAGLALSIFSNTTFVGLMLWNPQGSGKLLSVVRYMVGVNAIGTTALASFGYAFLLNAGAGVATAAPISAFTAITATRGACNNPASQAQGQSVALLGGGATLTTAMTWGRNSSFGSGTGAATVSTLNSGGIEEFDGAMIVPPGTVLAFTSAVLDGGTYTQSAIWEELPL